MLRTEKMTQGPLASEAFVTLLPGNIKGRLPR